MRLTGGEDGGFSPSVKKERRDNALDACFLAGAADGCVVRVGFWTLDLNTGRTYNAGESAPCVKLGTNPTNALEI